MTKRFSIRSPKELTYIFFGLIASIMALTYTGKVLQTENLFFIVLVLLILLVLIVIGIKDVVDRNSMPWYQKFNIPIMVLAIAISFFSSISYLISNCFFTKSSATTFTDFLTYYFWVLADMVPGLEINELTGFSYGVAPEVGAASLVVVGFRAFVLFIFFGILKALWDYDFKGRNKTSRK